MLTTHPLPVPGESPGNLPLPVKYGTNEERLIIKRGRCNYSYCESFPIDESFLLFLRGTCEPICLATTRNFHDPPSFFFSNLEAELTARPSVFTQRRRKMIHESGTGSGRRKSGWSRLWLPRNCPLSGPPAPPFSKVLPPDQEQEDVSWAIVENAPFQHRYINVAFVVQSYLAKAAQRILID